jgi:hypothetical protein
VYFATVQWPPCEAGAFPRQAVDPPHVHVLEGATFDLAL